MQNFITDYGLWLLLAVAIAIAAAFLLNRKAKPRDRQAVLREAAPLADAVPPAAEPAPPPLSPSPPAAAAAAPAPAPTPAPVAAAEEPDNLLRLKGIGPKVNAILNELGVTRYAQIAAWTEEDIARIDPRLGNFSGRIVRDQWVDQARYLAAGDIAGFEAKYGKL